MKLALALLETTHQLRNTQLLFSYRLWDMAKEADPCKRELLYLHDQMLDAEIEFTKLLHELTDRIEDFASDDNVNQVLCPKIELELETLTPDECLEIDGCLSVQIQCEMNRDGEYSVYFLLEDCPYERRFVINAYDKNFLNLFLQALTNEAFEL